MAVKRGRKQARRSGESSVPGWMWLLVGLLIGAAVAVTLYVKMPHAIDNLMPHPNPAAQPTVGGDTGVAPEGSVAVVPVEPKKPQYDFYTLLPEKEVIIPDEELSAQVKAETAAKLASQQQAAPTAVPSASPGATTANSAAISATNSLASPDASANPLTSRAATTAATMPTAPATAPANAAPKGGQYLLQAGAFRNGAQADDLKARIAMMGLVGRVEIVQTPAGEMHRVRLGPYTTASELEAAKQKLGGGGLPAVAIRVK